MSDFEAARRLLLSCSMCGTYYGYADLVVACEQADAAALEQASAALRAERPGLWATRCGCCEQQLPWQRVVEHRRSWSQLLLERAPVVPAPLCERCRQLAPILMQMRAELAALITEVERGGPGGGRP